MREKIHVYQVLALGAVIECREAKLGHKLYQSIERKEGKTTKATATKP